MELTQKKERKMKTKYGNMKGETTKHWMKSNNSFIKSAENATHHEINVATRKPSTIQSRKDISERQVQNLTEPSYISQSKSTIQHFRNWQNSQSRTAAGQQKSKGKTRTPDPKHQTASQQKRKANRSWSPTGPKATRSQLPPKTTNQQKPK